MDPLERIKLRLEMILYRLAELKRKELSREELNEELTHIEDDIRQFNEHYRAISNFK
jgi:hypothetical protein